LLDGPSNCLCFFLSIILNKHWFAYRNLNCKFSHICKPNIYITTRVKKFKSDKSFIYQQILILPKRTYMLSMRMVTDIMYSKVDILISPKMTAYVLTAWFTSGFKHDKPNQTMIYFMEKPLSTNEDEEE
jgi:hypothetical protein